MNRTFALSLLPALSLLASAGGAFAQTFSLEHFTLGGGGELSTGGGFALGGAAGQPEASPQPMTGGNFSLEGGFWPLTDSGPPRLGIERQGGEVRVFWPLTAAGFVLDHSLSPEGPWTPVPIPRETNSLDSHVRVPVAEGNAFYRLRQP